MKIMIKNSLVLLLVLSSVYLYGQEVRLPFELTKDNKSIFVRLPLENQKDSISYFFDTGASISLLDNKVAEINGLIANDKLSVSGAGGKKSYDLLTNYKMFLDSNHFIDSTNVVLDDLSRLSALSEIKLEGIIGVTILKEFITKIDFESKIISLYNYNDKMDYAGYEKISFELNGSGLFLVPIEVELNNNEKFKGKAYFDSGAGLALLVNTPFKEENNLLSKIDKKIIYQSNNLSNTTTYQKGLIKSIRLGDYSLGDANLAISMSSDKQGVSAQEGIIGILGSEIIHRFNMIIDYRDKAVYIKPNHIFNSEFKALVNPFLFRYNSQRTEVYISDVMKGTDAYKKGLKEGDKIISIDNKKSSDIDFYKDILEHDGRVVEIKYQNQKKQVKTVKVKLSRIL